MISEFEQLLVGFRSRAIENLDDFIEGLQMHCHEEPEAYEGCNIHDIWTWYAESF